MTIRVPARFRARSVHPRALPLRIRPFAHSSLHNFTGTLRLTHAPFQLQGCLAKAPEIRHGQRCFSISTPRNANAKIVNVPQMAESISEGVLAFNTEQVGDYVALDEELASIETDKIDVAVNASDSGTVTKFLVGEGYTVTVGQALIEIDVDAREKPASSANNSKPQEIKEPAAQKSPAGQKQEKIEEAPVPPKQQQPMAPAASSSPSQKASMSAYRGSRAENKVTSTPYLRPQSVI